MAQARLELDPYTVRVLDVVKGKFGLKNRNEALKKLVDEHGPAYAEMRIDEQILQELDRTVADHAKKHKLRKMTEQQLDILLGL